MTIYLKHPTHGTKVACSSMEAEYDESNGWVRYTVDTPAPKAEAVKPTVDAEEAPVVNTLQAKTRRKPV